MIDYAAAFSNLKFVLSKVAGFLKSAEAYRTYFTNDVHALYTRAMSRREFIRDMALIIDTQLRTAWKEGADESMVLPEDFTPEDDAIIQGIIDNEINYLDGLADDIQNAAGDKLGWETFQPRIDIWVNRYNDTANRAKVHFGGKIKYRWDLGQTEEHCETCQALNGLVAFSDEWETAGLHPQSPPNDLLECGGWKCDCTLNSTTERRTSGVLDKLLTIAVSRKL